jgi:DNA-binding HxlR family transcriptional regulator
MRGSYGQFCPIAMASEVLCTRWTPLIVRELMCGSTRFNDLRRGVPRMSPSLLSKRLGELQDAGLVDTMPVEKGAKSYRLTKAGEELRPIIMALGTWGQRWVETGPTLDNLDPELLIWDMHRCLDPTPLPARRVCIQFVFDDLKQEKRDNWLIIDPETGAEACYVDPGFDVDLYAECSLRTMTAIWLGLDTVGKAVERGDLLHSGDRELAAMMQQWLGLSPFAKDKKQVA